MGEERAPVVSECVGFAPKVRNAGRRQALSWSRSKVAAGPILFEPYPSCLVSRCTRQCHGETLLLTGLVTTACVTAGSWYVGISTDKFRGVLSALCHVLLRRMPNIEPTTLAWTRQSVKLSLGKGRARGGESSVAVCLLDGSPIQSGRNMLQRWPAKWVIYTRLAMSRRE
jgi:hypothetical protein